MANNFKHLLFSAAPYIHSQYITKVNECEWAVFYVPTNTV